MKIRSAVLLSSMWIAVAAQAGQRLEIGSKTPLQGSDAQAVLHALGVEDSDGNAPGKRQVQVKLRSEGGGSKLVIEVAGNSQLPADSAERIRQTFPALREAQITLQENAAPTPPAPPDPDQLQTPEQLAAYKKKLQDQLAAEGKKGTVEVTVTDGADGKKQVRVEVHAQQ